MRSSFPISDLERGSGDSIERVSGHIKEVFLSIKSAKGILGYLAMLLFLFTHGTSSAQTVTVQTLSILPTLDGSDKEWGKIPFEKIFLKKNKEAGFSDVQSVSLKAGVFREDIYIFAQWKDSTEDLIHKPFIWNEGEQRYVKGPQREDRFSIQFAMGGEYTTSWLSGKEFTADMWHWKSSRTNPIGLAHDKMTIITSTPMRRSYKTVAKNGKEIYIFRPSDQGTKIYNGIRYSQKKNDVMPKYLLTENPAGSITDVKAKGVWKNGMWRLEIKRKLNTGNADDAAFQRGEAVKAGIGIFNRSEADDHNISEVLTFQF